MPSPVQNNLPDLNEIMQEMRLSHPQYAHLGDHTLAAAILQKFPALAKGYESAKQFALQATQMAQVQSQAAKAQPTDNEAPQAQPTPPTPQQTAQNGLGIADMIHNAVHGVQQDVQTGQTLYQAQQPPAQEAQ